MGVYKPSLARYIAGFLTAYNSVRTITAAVNRSYIVLVSMPVTHVQVSCTSFLGLS